MLGKFFLTGQPGSGKSTVFLNCIKLLREMGYSVGGISTPEIRKGGRRIGFRVVDIATGRKEILAGVDIKSAFRVGRYGVNLHGFESVALPGIDYAEDSCDVICIDEIGRMELFSGPFKTKVDEVMRGSKPLVAVLHRNYIHEYTDIGEIYHVSHENRDILPRIIVSSLERQINRSSRDTCNKRDS
jgi:nucleoside-triphosphatase